MTQIMKHFLLNNQSSIRKLISLSNKPTSLSSIRTVIATSFTSQRDDEVFMSRLSGEHNGIVVLSLNRPKAANSLSKSLVRALNNSIYQLAKDDEIRVLIIRSVVPGVFCAGADLRERASMHIKEVPLFVSKLRSISSAIADFPHPTIAAIDGAALGGGLEYALAADLRVASMNAKLGLVETKLAIIPGAGGTQRLPRMIPAHIAKELIFTGRIIDGQQAFQYGMVNYVVPQNQTHDAAYQRSVSLAEEMLQTGPIALKAAKMAINRGSEVDINTGLAIEGACYQQCVQTKDRIEGLQAFQEKRPPNYQGE
ncbi:methylglutaconyl-CoA hydratase, mitochondrial [Dermatophagoides farinae]|uniref:Enoyl-coa hydratase domain-containing protein 2 n=1 Tax=Dermatophagoides farinae TaxID=6954 RepID=A0A922L8K3_DERFA|nr:methylglutaconyl-CoA hydratase, mitochondrial-like [Dermatophagoides farinae]KAH7646649.1 enoyl-coa hydratase domain-containing protein 2 [Dermatophagoides farinae]KAH9517197.1 hypothetical protein DERF_007880 [Dermatophagoides farinae]